MREREKVRERGRKSEREQEREQEQVSTWVCKVQRSSRMWSLFGILPDLVNQPLVGLLLAAGGVLLLNLTNDTAAHLAGPG